MVLTSDMKKETNKERIYDMMEKYYGNDTVNEEELNYIEEISKSTQATNDVIQIIKSYIDEFDENTSEEKKESYLQNLFKLAKIRMDNNDEYAEKGNIKYLSNMDKINDMTSKYFENSEELEMAIKNEKTKEKWFHIRYAKRNSRHDDSSGDYRRSCIFLPDSESDFDQQYICVGDHYRTLCTITCVNGYDDPECGLIADRICNLRERIWGEDGIYEYLAASVSGGI